MVNHLIMTAMTEVLTDDGDETDVVDPEAGEAQ